VYLAGLAYLPTYLQLGYPPVGDPSGVAIFAENHTGTVRRYQPGIKALMFHPKQLWINTLCALAADPGMLVDPC
jgi:hypothetical protein